MFCAWSHALSMVLLLLNRSLCPMELVLWEKITLSPQSFHRIILALAFYLELPQEFDYPGSLLSRNYFVFFIVHPHFWDIDCSVVFRFLFVAYNLSFCCPLLKINVTQLSFSNQTILLSCSHLPISKFLFHVNWRLVPSWESFSLISFYSVVLDAITGHSGDVLSDGHTVS